MLENAVRVIYTVGQSASTGKRVILPDKADKIVEVKIDEIQEPETEEGKKKRLVAEINKIRPIHKIKGICYIATVTVLSSYRNIKFNTIEENRQKFIEHLEAKDLNVEESNPFVVVFEKLALLDQHNKNRTDNIEARMLETASIIQKIDIALDFAFGCDKRLATIDMIHENERLKRIIEEKYTLRKTGRLSTDDLILNSGVKKTEYYRRLEEATEKVSIALWGSMGERHIGFNKLLLNIMSSKK